MGARKRARKAAIRAIKRRQLETARAIINKALVDGGHPEAVLDEAEARKPGPGA